MNAPFVARALLADLVALPGPPGQETAVRDYVARQVQRLGLTIHVDEKGNLLAGFGQTPAERPVVVVTAHLDEIALMVTNIADDGALDVAALGGAHPWKWGEGPVEVLGRDGAPSVPGVLSLGSIHTDHPAALAQRVRSGGAAPGWRDARVFTGQSRDRLAARGIRPGSRVVLARSRRTLFDLGDGDRNQLVAAYFLDDRADLVAWLLALETLAGDVDFPGRERIVFAATACEEVGGEGALYLLHALRPPVCVALEIGPRTPDADFALDATPTVWVSDTFAASDPRDLDLLETAANKANLPPLHFQAVTRGGSDASCAASRGLCARPVTLAFAAENSHGFEIMHAQAPQNLARLLVAYLKRLLDDAAAQEARP